MADSDCQSEIEEVEELEAVHMEGKLPDYMAEWQHPPVVPGPLHVDGRPPADDFLDEEQGAAMAEAAFSFLEEVEGAPGDPAAGSSTDGPPLPPPPDPPQEPWHLLSDQSPQGYYHLGGRQVLRVQRGRPVNSVTITCYRHRGCSICVPGHLCGTDEDIFKWLFEVEPTPDGAHASVNKPLAKQHMDSGRAKWSAKAHKAKAKAKAAA
eukprot:4703828-Pyramimonas_sp.AAC.2